MKTARSMVTLGLSLALLVGPGGSSSIAQTSPATGGTAAAPAAAAPAAASTAAAAAAPSTAAAPVAAAGFSKEQLEQLVAPIALYSDSLLMQILMASTYPIEVVEAERFVTANPGLTGTKLDEALKGEDWDPSVKGLCTVPEVLKKMSANLDWTQDLGDAFLGQKDQLLDTVQVMRGKANDAGNLKTTEQQVVTVKEEKIIVIESPSPEVVYVPTYSPTVVYGGWYYPSYYYPPMYPYYPPGAGLVTFGVGVAVGAAIWGNCNWGWGHHDVDIDVNRYNNFNRNTNVNHRDVSGNRASWNHDASHRKGVNYQNSKVAGQYGGKQGSSRVSRDQARGYSSGSTGTRQARTPSASTQSRQGQAGSGQRSASASQRSSSASQRSSSASQRSSSGSSGRSAYSGSSKPSYDRASSSRGSSSRGTSSYGGSRGGGSYGGSRGGGSRGGGGRRR